MPRKKQSFGGLRQSWESRLLKSWIRWSRYLQRRYCIIVLCKSFQMIIFCILFLKTILRSRKTRNCREKQIKWDRDEVNKSQRRFRLGCLMSCKQRGTINLFFKSRLLERSRPTRNPFNRSQVRKYQLVTPRPFGNIHWFTGSSFKRAGP